MRWKVEISGHSFDLVDLETTVVGLDAQAFTDGDTTFLHAERFEQMDTAEEVNRAAEALITTVNACLRLSDPAAQPLAVGPVVDAKGARTHFVAVCVTASARARVGGVGVTVSGGAISRPSSAKPEQAKRARLIASNPDVARAVNFLNEPDRTFGSLWKALEIVKDDLGNGNPKKGAEEVERVTESIWTISTPSGTAPIIRL